MNKGILQLDESVIQKLNALVQGTGQTPEEFIAGIVNGLTRNRTEDETLLAECEARWGEFEETRLAVPLDDVLEWVNSWGAEHGKPVPQCRKF